MAPPSETENQKALWKMLPMNWGWKGAKRNWKRGKGKAKAKVAAVVNYGAESGGEREVEETEKKGLCQKIKDGLKKLLAFKFNSKKDQKNKEDSGDTK
ncbi:hypothetical protein AMTR_s00140p00050120 [Amborella trichopoda]|uniref:Uncharacterized protein n=1 Tax=Amborella trichopoda TaxID=13333 RepID=W1PA30_AMBTC|nr:hypothetical protein AMTR_s00140p00050120 [Amborella trichopoda]